MKAAGKLLSVVWVVCVALLVAACAARPTAAPSKPLIKLAVNPWVAAELNAAVAQIILQDSLGFPVELVPIDEYQQWESLAKGQVHASLEVWPSGHAEDVKTYIETQHSVEHGGELGPVGKMGWYIPSYLLRKYPELASWEGFKDPQNVALFSSPETGNKGRFLAGDPSWVQYDEDIIRNLGLDFQVVRLGSEEALIAALDAAYGKQEPILLYFWTPHWAYILYDLTPVTLPAYSGECYAKAEQGGIDCDYPAEPLFKVFWPGLKEYAPEAYTVLKNMNYTNRDQIAMMAMVQIDKKSSAQAARAWIEQNEPVWKAWLP